MKMSITVRGLDEMLERVKKTGANMDGLVSEALEQGAELVSRDIKAWAEKHKRSGRVLGGVFKSGVLRSGDFLHVKVGISDEQSKGAWHATFVEYGTPRAKADPGIRPAFKRNKTRIRELQKKALERGGVQSE
jgi:HK97 gp10 family phage protein